MKRTTPTSLARTCKPDFRPEDVNPSRRAAGIKEHASFAAAVEQYMSTPVTEENPREKVFVGTIFAAAVLMGFCLCLVVLTGG